MVFPPVPDAEASPTRTDVGRAENLRPAFFTFTPLERRRNPHPIVHLEHPDRPASQGALGRRQFDPRAGPPLLVDVSQGGVLRSSRAGV
jgi:hypothetical protein